uniref:Uncharacterized protein n=1 Tax=Chromera velia CCMP2878 TaxID=1169474 RepID=A0A0G4FPB0_9ALVE|eukprot:Cvel_17896.t1-p1 / transcript=Cvel_17896.t1 / gene=Cvel_17896 / organism=Chromera_velia_CCMP2878 / gene_product=Canalicular multispecific organic anion transporter, putative / transcript_product=Canalicular multispecific organic anion transporter, putative / location=Cvel_scaffold1452:31697-46251(+) / protein_length=1884 / sequence_SO=supercontig / SO=protein_coding / is_pseudo=false
MPLVEHNVFLLPNLNSNALPYTNGVWPGLNYGFRVFAVERFPLFIGERHSPYSWKCKVRVGWRGQVVEAKVTCYQGPLVHYLKAEMGKMETFPTTVKTAKDWWRSLRVRGRGSHQGVAAERGLRVCRVQTRVFVCFPFRQATLLLWAFGLPVLASGLFFSRENVQGPPSGLFFSRENVQGPPSVLSDGVLSLSGRGKGSVLDPSEVEEETVILALAAAVSCLAYSLVLHFEVRQGYPESWMVSVSVSSWALVYALLLSPLYYRIATAKGTQEQRLDSDTALVGLSTLLFLPFWVCYSMVKRTSQRTKGDALQKVQPDQTQARGRILGPERGEGNARRLVHHQNGEMHSPASPPSLPPLPSGSSRGALPASRATSLSQQSESLHTNTRTEAHRRKNGTKASNGESVRMVEKPLLSSDKYEATLGEDARGDSDLDVRVEDDVQKGRKESPELSAGLLSRCTWSWLWVLILEGNRRPLTNEDLYVSKPGQRSEELHRKFAKEWERAKRRAGWCLEGPPSPSEGAPRRKRGNVLLGALWRTFWSDFFYGGGMRFLAAVCELLGPLLLNRVVRYLDPKSEPAPLSTGLLLVVAMFVTAALGSYSTQKYLQETVDLGMRIKTVLSSEIYRKSLRASLGSSPPPSSSAPAAATGAEPSSSSSSTAAASSSSSSAGAPSTRQGEGKSQSSSGSAGSTGEVVNLMAVDSQKFMDNLLFFHSVWYAPIVVAQTLTVLWLVAGLPVFAGFAVILLNVPVTAVMTRAMRKIQKEMMTLKDERIKLTSETLNAMKVIKMYAWERFFRREISSTREKELNLLQRQTLLMALNLWIFFSTPVTVAVAFFVCLALWDQSEQGGGGTDFDAATAFTALALFNNLRLPLQIFPFGINFVMESRVSLQRLEDFFGTPEVPPLPALPADGRTALAPGTAAVEAKEASLIWPGGTPLLSGVTFKCFPGQLTGIAGSTGSGKSGLLQAVLGGEVRSVEGSVERWGSIAFAAQVPWVQNATLQENITFGGVHDPQWYKKVISACALETDIELLPAGDQTEIGGRGVNLSGGQKARVALARAVYARADLTVLDDVLAAVDSRVALHIFEQCILGLLKDRCVILVTHKLDLLPRCDQVVFLKDSSIRYVGDFAGFSSLGSDFAQFSAEEEKAAPEENEEEMEEAEGNGQDLPVPTSLFRTVSSCGPPRRSLSEELNVTGVIRGRHQERHSPQIPRLSSDVPHARPHARSRRETEEDFEDSLPGNRDAMHATDLCCLPDEQASILFSCASSFVLERELSASSHTDGGCVHRETSHASRGSRHPPHGRRALEMLEEEEGGGEDGEGTLALRKRPTSSSSNGRPQVGRGAKADGGVSLKGKGAMGEAEEGEERGDDFEDQKADGLAESARKKKGAITEEEKLELGAVSKQVYMAYVRNSGGVLMLLTIMFFMAGSQTCQVLANTWLKYWSDDPGRVGATTGLTIFGVLCFGQVLLLWIELWFLGRSKAMAAKAFHDQLLDGILRAPTGFFDATPVGRILNRFSRDVQAVDESIYRNLQNFIVQACQAIATGAVIVMVVPPFAGVLLFLGFFYWGAQKFYISASRQLKRLESSLKSPVFAHFGESLDGVQTIRAFRKETLFELLNDRKSDESNRAFYLSSNANRWLGIRLEFLGNLTTTTCAALCILVGRGNTPGDAALAITYALSVTRVLNWMTRQMSELEMNVVSVERIREYAERAPREREGGEPGSVRPEWPEKGEIVFDQLCLRYRPSMPLVLTDLAFRVSAGEKVGIVGRTGAGKSSMMTALLRLVEHSAGRICVDDRDISEVCLEELRSKLSVIPQDPSLFTGTLRFNLDPGGERSDFDLWQAIDTAHLMQKAQQVGGMDGIVTEGGKNFSVGERQMLCMARCVADE